MEESAGWKLRLPKAQPPAPVVAILRRVMIAVSIVLANWLLVLVERDGYRDAGDGEVSVGDALYYTTVTLSTTGYGDITPVSDSARLVNALLVTPMRFLFVLVLIGTTIQVLTERSRDQFNVARWRSRVKDHVIICGYGTKGRSAVRALLQNGVSKDQIVVIDVNHDNVEKASADGMPTVHGSVTSDGILWEAEVEKARAVIVAVDRDDTAVLTTLTVRQIAPQATVVAAVRETENADLLTQSGANSVITSSDAAGRLLGLATGSPATVALVEDMIASGRGVDLVERPVKLDEVGQSPLSLSVRVVAVVRKGRHRAFDDPAVSQLRPNDHVIYVSTPRTRDLEERAGT